MTLVEVFYLSKSAFFCKARWIASPAVSTGNYEDRVLNVRKVFYKLCSYIHTQGVISIPTALLLVITILLGQLYDTVIKNISLKVGQIQVLIFVLPFTSRVNLSQLYSVSLHFLTFTRVLTIIINSMNFLEELNNVCEIFSIILGTQ